MLSAQAGTAILFSLLFVDGSNCGSGDKLVRQGSVLCRTQQGFLLFELVVVMMIASLLATWAASRWASEIDDHAASSTGVWLARVGDAVRQELKVRANAWQEVTLTQSSRFDSDRSDRVETLSVRDLITAGHLPEGFLTQPSLRYELTVHVRQRIQTSCFRLLCGLEALILLRPSASEFEHAQDSNRLGKLLTTLSGTGLVVHPLNVERLKGPQLDLANPPWGAIELLPAGTIGMHVSNPVLLKPRDRFGGVYVSPHGGDCKSWGLAERYLNPLTGNCTCPEGYVPRQLAEWRIDPPHEHSFQATGVRSYICVAPL
jgi:hypothetical protein